MAEVATPAPPLASRGLGAAGWVALACVALLALCAAVPGLLAPFEPLAIDPRGAFAPPSLAHPFGTDDSGRDVRADSSRGAASRESMSASSRGQSFQSGGGRSAGGGRGGRR